MGNWVTQKKGKNMVEKGKRQSGKRGILLQSALLLRKKVFPPAKQQLLKITSLKHTSFGLCGNRAPSDRAGEPSKISGYAWTLLLWSPSESSKQAGQHCSMETSLQQKPKQETTQLPWAYAKPWFDKGGKKEKKKGQACFFPQRELHYWRLQLLLYKWCKHFCSPLPTNTSRWQSSKLSSLFHSQ